MKLYALPDEFRSKIPSFSEPFDRRADQAAQDQFVKDLADHLRKIGWTGAMTGEIWHHPIADGAAQYMVMDAPAPRKAIGLMHLPLGDAWEVPEPLTRGLRRTDIITAVKRNKAIAKLFGNKS